MSKEIDKKPDGEPIENIENPSVETCCCWEERAFEDVDVACNGKVCDTCEMYDDALCVLWGVE